VITLVFKDERGRVCRVAMPTMGSAFSRAWLLLKVEPYRQACQFLTGS
jgi:hypothetical protein